MNDKREIEMEPTENHFFFFKIKIKIIKPRELCRSSDKWK